MEQHPVPRNISGFQFHLIGDMTLRQFGYLAGGVAIGFLIFKTAPLPSLFKFLFAGMPALAGCAFAFLPIQERPLDKWIILFIKSIYAPTQFLWQKEGILPSVLTTVTTTHVATLPLSHAAAHEDARQKLNTYLSTLPATPHQTLNLREKNYLDKTLALFSTAGTTTSSSVSAPAPSAIPTQTVSPQPSSYVPKLHIISDLSPTIPISSTAPQEVPSIPVKKYLEPHKEPVSIQEEQPSVATQPIAPTLPGSSLEYETLNKKLQDLSAEKEHLAKELELLRRTSDKTTDSVIIKPVVGVEQVPTIKSVTAKTAVDEIGMPSLPQYPNLIVGVIKDGERKVLPNILITIKDKNGVPLRALKTNKLGHFAAATPLPSGIYYIEIEDPLKRFNFDIAEVTLSGHICLPIEVTAKSQKEVLREQLNKALFGNPAA